MLRPAIVIRRCLSQRSGVAVRSFASSNDNTPSKNTASGLTPYDESRAEIEGEKSVVQRKVEAMTKVDPWMVYGVTEKAELPDLPDNEAEISALDPAHHTDKLTPSGEKRMCHVRQEEWKPGQNPLTAEKKWMISFLEGDTTAANNWDNPLMGWVSGSDVMAGNMGLQMYFETASEAVYFAKKRGWNFVVEEPILRPGRNDDAQYQDCFLPQTVTAKLRNEEKDCDHWKRQASGTSHYMRPLKYHGDGEVEQFGPNGLKDKAPHVDSYFKIR